MRHLKPDRSAIALFALILVLACTNLRVSSDAQVVTKQSEARRSALTFLTTDNYPPFNYVDEEGVLTGFNVDMARAICLELSIRCNIVKAEWDHLFTRLNRRHGGAVIAGHTISARALGEVAFTDSYFFTPGRFAARRDLGKLEITPEGLEGRRIGVAAGTAHAAFVADFFKESAIVVFANQELARDALIARKVDLVFDDGVGLVLWLNGTLSLACCELRGGAFLEPKYFGEGMAIAVRREDDELRADLNRALKRIQQSGRLEELMLRYFPYRLL